jgi:tetratricopeptide (TPR) repeat protein
MRWLVALACGLLLVRPAHGQAPATVLGDANAALSSGDYQKAAHLADIVARAPGPADVDRAEAWRLLGLAQFFLGKRARAKAAFYEYLKLDPDGGLDPALVPEEAVALIAEVRGEHEAELAALRPRPKRKRSFWLNFVPLAGQWQNGDRGKMWILGSAGTVLLAANITSFVMLSRWCGGSGDTCDDGVPGEPGYSNHIQEARSARTINVASGVALIALYAFGVYDGIRGHRRLDREEEASRPALGVGASDGGMWVTVGGAF